MNKSYKIGDTFKNILQLNGIYNRYNASVQ